MPPVAEPVLGELVPARAVSVEGVTEGVTIIVAETLASRLRPGPSHLVAAVLSRKLRNRAGSSRCNG